MDENLLKKKKKPAEEKIKNTFQKSAAKQPVRRQPVRKVASKSTFQKSAAKQPLRKVAPNHSKKVTPKNKPKLRAKFMPIFHASLCRLLVQPFSKVVSTSTYYRTRYR